jgi:hypothetical protein
LGRSDDAGAVPDHAVEPLVWVADAPRKPMFTLDEALGEREAVG